jgi:general secretion pathway protein D
MKRQFVVICMLAGSLIAMRAAAQVPIRPAPPASKDAKPGANGDTKSAEPGFVSKKTGKSFNEAHVEDITNENFPDMIESFDYPNAEIADVIKAISELTGKNFIVDPQVRGKITIIAPSRITVAEAYKAFLSALAINGLAVVPGDGFYKIKQARQAQRDSIETYAGAYYPTSDQMITRIVKLKYISAEEIQKQVRTLNSKDGEMAAYTPTNSLIISDYGASVDRIIKIINQLDVQGFEEQMEVIRIRHARSKDISDLVDQIINKGEKSTGGQFGGGIPRFRRTGAADSTGNQGAEVYSLVVADDRTNSIIVVGNRAGIDKIKRLVARLDFPMRPDEQGGVFVYYVRHSEAEAIATTLNGIVTESKKAQDQAAKPPGPGQAPAVAASTAIFSADVKISPDKNTNSLIIVASKPDYELVKNLLSKIDIPRDQVYITAVIMEMSANATNSWGVDIYKFARGTNGIGRIGFRGSESVDTIINPTNDSGAILGFGSGDLMKFNFGTTSVEIPDFISLIRLLKTTNNVNILSTPQIMAIDNQEAVIEVGEKIPVAKNDTPTTGGAITSNITRENVTTKLTITPYISPDTDSVQMKVDQQVADLSLTTVGASELAKNAVATTTRNIKTQLIVNSGDTAVLGGLMKDQETEKVIKVPVLGDIPIIGWLFKSQTVNKNKSNLIVFLTPKIVRQGSDNASIVDQKIAERITFIQKNMGGRDVHGSAIDALPRKKNAKSVLRKKVNDPVESEEPAVETF